MSLILHSLLDSKIEITHMIVFFGICLQSTSHSYQKKLIKVTLWQHCLPLDDTVAKKRLKQFKLQFLHDNLIKHRSELDSQLFSVCRSFLCIDFFLWIPMFHIELSLCIRWHLGWLPGGKSKLCPRYPHQRFTKTYSIDCLSIH